MQNSQDENSEVRPELRRDITLVDAVGIGLGAIIGAGIFVVTGVAAGVAGPAFLIGLLIAGMAAACNALSSAELAATYPQSGGTYEYGYRLLSPSAGFAAGWMFLASKLAAGGTVALGFGAYLSKLVPSVPAKYAAVGGVLVLTAANLFGIKKAGKLNTAIVAVTLLTLVVFAAVGIPSFDTANLTPFAPFGILGIAESSALMFFAYTGYARIATLGEEVHEPKKTIPRAIVITIIVSIMLYAAVAIVAVGSIGAPGLAATSSPLQEASRSFAFPGVVWVVGIGATTAMFGVLLSQIVGISRMMFAMARRRDLPDFLGHVSNKHAVPAIGIILTGGVILVLAVFGTLEFVISAASFTILIYYGIANICALRLAKKDKIYPKWISATGLIFCSALAISLPWIVVGTGLATLAVGFMFRMILRSIPGSSAPTS
ncbi:MAG: amino acid permease [Chloracidobacterium sp.]|nr:amino acid permease [Chloracidobacterium sp.]